MQFFDPENISEDDKIKEEIRRVLLEESWPDFKVDPDKSGLYLPIEKDLILNNREYFIDQTLYIAEEENVKISPTATAGLYEYFKKGMKLARDFYSGLSEQLKNILQNEMQIDHLFKDRQVNLLPMYFLSNSLKTISNNSLLPYDSFSSDRDTFHCKKSIIIATIFSPFLRIEESINSDIIKDSMNNGIFISQRAFSEYEKELAILVNKDFKGISKLTRGLKDKIFRMRA